jgi:hypothetical protein
MFNLESVKGLKLNRIERISKFYNEQNLVVREQYEYWFPDDGDGVGGTEIGFKIKKRKKK